MNLNCALFSDLQAAVPAYGNGNVFRLWKESKRVVLLSIARRYRYSLARLSTPKGRLWRTGNHTDETGLGLFPLPLLNK